MPFRTPLDLPAPDPDALTVSERLKARIREEIRTAGGSIGFRRYMEMALYEPALGYYSGGAHKFGAAGDFVTAPEISPLFSRALARQCAEVLTHTGGDLLEFGAGSGRMAADLLTALEAEDALPPRYLIMELSAGLREVQHQTLSDHCPQLLERVTWIDRLPETFTGMAIGNEVLDAMPVTCFVQRESALMERRVCLNGDEPAWCEQPADAAIADCVNALGMILPQGYTSEFNPNLPGWMQGIADMLTQGVALLIDYGYPRREYYLPERHMGTLLCHYRHRAHEDPFLYPGLTDITASVDFTAVAEAGADAGLDLLGYTSQAWFLLGCSLEQHYQAALNGDAAHDYALAQQMKTLTLPGEMGERFQAIAFGKDYAPDLAGFALNNQTYRL
ncbi:MAG: SAM-dependent methyltransferase [Gammaproteobacteria bacterium]